MHKILLFIGVSILESISLFAQYDAKISEDIFVHKQEEPKQLICRQDNIVYRLAENIAELTAESKALYAYNLGYSEEKWSEIFEQNKQLEVLYWSEETELPQNITQLSSLEYLFIVSGTMHSLPSGFKKLKRLKVLTLRHPDFKDNQFKLSDEIFELENLQELGLNSCYLKHIPDKITQLKKLRKLDLSQNDLVTLPENLGSLKNLESLWLNNNRITFLPQSICELSKLEVLNLGENRLSCLPDKIGGLINLKELDLSQNNLKKLPTSITELVNLKKLNLISFDGNNEDVLLINKIFSELDNLEELHLSNLFYLPFSKLTSEKIHTLSLPNIAIKPLDIKILCRLKVLKQLNLYEFSIPKENKEEILKTFDIIDDTNIDKLKQCLAENFNYSIRIGKVNTNDALNRNIFQTPCDCNLQLIKAAYEKDKSEANRKQLATEYSNIAWNFMHEARYRDALNYIEKGMQIDLKNIFLNSNYPLALALDGQIDEAKKVYLSLQNKPFNEQYSTFKEVFLDDIQTFENTESIPQKDMMIFNSIKEWLSK